MNETLARELAGDAIPHDQFADSDRPILAMMSELLGGVPNCYPMLAIWPTGLRTFNLLVPNLLNLPKTLVGHGPPKELVGLAMYAASEAAGCAYCIAHHCSFAIRRGLGADTMLGRRNGVETAVADLAAAMATVPSTVTPDHVRAVEALLPERDVEGLVLAVALGGFLNKFMDSIGVELEESCLTDVQALLRPMGWHPGKHRPSGHGAHHGRSPVDVDVDVDVDAGHHRFDASDHRDATDGFDLRWTQVDTSAEIPVDGFGTYLRLMRQAPGAARRDRAWSRGVSGRLGPALLLLEEEVGYSFPILGSLSNARAVRALTAALRDNLDPAASRIGLEPKLLAGLVYAEHVGSTVLAQECTLLLDHLDVTPDPWRLRSTRRFATTPTESLEVPPGLSSVDASILLLARSCAASPADISEVVVSAIAPHLDADQIIEVVVWLSLLQTLHRLYGFYEAKSLAAEVDADVVV